jgi:hypothetical protein
MLAMIMIIETCCICGRPYGGEMQKHHLKPQTFKSRMRNIHDQENLVTIHKICHAAIHAFFKEKELFNYYHTPERLHQHIDIINFVEWVKNKPLDFYLTMRRSNKRK